MPRLVWLLTALVLGVHGSAFAQPWSGVIDPRRAIDWAAAGVNGGIPRRTTICATLNPGVTAAQITAAISGCPSGQVVFLNAGNYTLTNAIVFNNVRNVTLRGAGPDKTFLIFAGVPTGNCGSSTGGDICFVNGNPNGTRQPSNVASWTAGYAKGTTQITLSSTTNLRIGTMIILDQKDDASDTGTVFACGTNQIGVCCSECNSGVGRPDTPWRDQQQLVRVTAINGNIVTITPGLYMPNWRASQSPGAWWSNDTPISMSGIEDLSVDHTASTSGIQAGIFFMNAYNCWVKNVRSIRANRSHVWFYQSAHITVRDSYFYGTLNAVSQSYGIEYFMTSDTLVENNIFQHITGPIMVDTSEGAVAGYNFSTDDFYQVTGWAQPSSYHHGASANYQLWEGNDGFGLIADQIHGTANFITAFRNRYHGFDVGLFQQTLPVNDYALSRYFNLIGNVLGTSGYHNTYQTNAGGSTSTCNTSIYALGWGGNCGSGPVPDDALVAATIMRWGNYDTVNAASRFVASEVPTTAPGYPNPVPASQVLPVSFYLTSQPTTWWKTPWGTPAWPPIGPDVLGGNDPGVGGHAHKIPARLCFENSPLDTARYGSLSPVPILFSANTCYAATSAPPSAPTAIQVQ